MSITSSVISNVSGLTGNVSDVASLISGSTEFKASSINSFLATFGGIQKATDYHVHIQYPDFVSKRFNRLIERDTVLIDNIQTPPVVFNTHIQTMNGKRKRLPYMREVNEISIDFKNDSKMKFQEYLNFWMNGIIDPVNNKTKHFEDDYVGTIILSILDSSDRVIKKYNIQQVVPTSISPITFSHDSNGEISKTNVIFTYQSCIDEHLLTSILNNEQLLNSEYGNMMSYLYDIDDVTQNISSVKSLLSSNLSNATGSLF